MVDLTSSRNSLGSLTLECKGVASTHIKSRGRILTDIKKNAADLTAALSVNLLFDLGDYSGIANCQVSHSGSGSLLSKNVDSTAALGCKDSSSGVAKAIPPRSTLSTVPAFMFAPDKPMLTFTPETFQNTEFLRIR